MQTLASLSSDSVGGFGIDSAAIVSASGNGNGNGAGISNGSGNDNGNASGAGFKRPSKHRHSKGRSG